MANVTSSTINDDGTVNITLAFKEDAICLQDCDQLIEWVAQGKDSTGVLWCLAEEIAKAVSMPTDYVKSQVTKYGAVKTLKNNAMLVEAVYELAFGDDAINKNYIDAEVLAKLREFSDTALTVEATESVELNHVYTDLTMHRDGTCELSPDNIGDTISMLEDAAEKLGIELAIIDT